MGNGRSSGHPSQATRPPSLLRYLRRRRGVRVWLSVAAALVLVALMWADRRGWLLYDGGDMARYDGQTFVVDYVIDGDTIVVQAPDGDALTTRVRLWGINCPELGDSGKGDAEAERWAEMARDRVRQWIGGRQVYLELEPHRVRGHYGRVLAYVRMPDGAWLNERLLMEGLTYADDRWPHRHIERYDLLEMQARKQGLGVWTRNAH